MQRVQKSIMWAVLVSETSHVFCCVLPTLFSIVGLIGGLGFVVALPPGLEWLHETLHTYEIPMIMASAAILAIGWGLDALARKLDCHDTGCVHGGCAPQKSTAHKILVFATILFVINVMIYFGFHADITH